LDCVPVAPRPDESNHSTPAYVVNEPLRNRTTKEELEDIPGTYVFNRERCRQGLHLNLLFSS